MWLLDNDLKAVLTALIDERMAPKRKDIFFVPRRDLEFKSGVKKTKLITCLDTLYENGLIAIRCEGQGKGEGQDCNSYRLNYEAMNAYSEMSYQDLQNPSMKIESKRANHTEGTLYMQENNPFPNFYGKPQNVDTIEDIQYIQEVQEKQNPIKQRRPTTKGKEEWVEDVIFEFENKADQLANGLEWPNYN